MKTTGIAFALTGSFCCINPCLRIMRKLTEMGAAITPIMSEAVYETDTRFYEAAKLRDEVRGITKSEIIHTISGAEPLGPKDLADMIIIAPCTGNTIAKIAHGINDTAVTMAAKSLLRNNKPLIIAVSTNDGLSAQAQNIGILLNRRNVYFVPFAQDDPVNKPRSLVANFDLIPDTAQAAKENKQLQPIAGTPR